MIVDASVIVSALNPTDAFHRQARGFLQAQEAAPQHLAAPTLLLAEVASGLRRALSDPRLAYQAWRALEVEGLMGLVPVSSIMARRAAELSLELGLHGCDAFYVALAEQRGEPLISLDRRQLERARGVIEAREP